VQLLSIPTKKRIYSIAFSPSGRDVAAACGDGKIRVWDRSTGDVRQWISIGPTSDGYEIIYLDEDRLVFAGSGLSWWDIPGNGWNNISPLHLWRRRLCLSPDGRYLAVADEAESIDNPMNGLFVFDTSEWFHLPRMERCDMTTGGIAFSPDGKFFATGHMLRVGEKLRSYTYVPGTYTVHDYDYVVHLREMPSGKIIQTSEGWQQKIGKLAFSPDGRILAGGAGPRLRIWDVEENREVALHKRGAKHFQGISFTADGRFLLTVSNDETARVWDTRSWQEHSTYTWETGKLLNIALSPDGLVAAAGSDRGKIVIWDLDL
jgi:WD40 repeat protein